MKLVTTYQCHRWIFYFYCLDFYQPWVLFYIFFLGNSDFHCLREETYLIMINYKYNITLVGSKYSCTISTAQIRTFTCEFKHQTVMSICSIKFSTRFHFSEQQDQSIRVFWPVFTTSYNKPGKAMVLSHLSLEKLNN